MEAVILLRSSLIFTIFTLMIVLAPFAKHLTAAIGLFVEDLLEIQPSKVEVVTDHLGHIFVYATEWLPRESISSALSIAPLYLQVHDVDFAPIERHWLHSVVEYLADLTSVCIKDLHPLFCK